MPARNRRQLILSALFVVQGAAFYGLSRRAEVIPPSKPLADFPAAIGALADGAGRRD